MSPGATRSLPTVPVTLRVFTAAAIVAGCSSGVDVTQVQSDRATATTESSDTPGSGTGPNPTDASSREGNCSSRQRISNGRSSTRASMSPPRGPGGLRDRKVRVDCTSQVIALVSPTSGSARCSSTWGPGFGGVSSPSSPSWCRTTRRYSTTSTSSDGIRAVPDRARRHRLHDDYDRFFAESTSRLTRPGALPGRRVAEEFARECVANKAQISDTRGHEQLGA